MIHRSILYMSIPIAPLIMEPTRYSNCHSEEANILHDHMAHPQRSKKNLSFTPARSFFFQPHAEPDDRSGFRKRDSSVAVVSIYFMANIFFSGSGCCELLPQNDMQEQAPSMRYNHWTGYRFPVQARDRLRRYEVRSFRQLKSFNLGMK